MKKSKNGNLMARRNRAGYWYVAPFLIGFPLFVLIPVIQSMYYSFGDIQIIQGGYLVSQKGWANYQYILFTDTAFREQLLTSISQTLSNTLIVLPFSFFSALLLQKSFPGRTLARAVFFLPVVISVGVLATVDEGSAIMQTVMGRNATMNASGQVSENALNFVSGLFANSLPPIITQYIAQAADGLYSVIIKSGVQIIIFLGGLNTISPSVYEASDIEGATAWVNFWKITFPLSGPYLLLNAVYTLIDSFTARDNPLINRIWTNLTGLKDFGIASAAAWLYFIVMAAVLGLVFLIASRRVYYRE